MENLLGGLGFRRRRPGRLAMWPRFLNAAIGVWLMAAPAVIGYGGVAADADRIAGPTVAATALIAVTEATRSIRWLNLPIGVGLVILPFLLDYSLGALSNSVACGLAIAALSLVRGSLSRQIGGGWAALRGRGSNWATPPGDGSPPPG